MPLHGGPYFCQALRRWGSGNGCRWRILLEAPSHKPARRRSGCDGRLVLTWDDSTTRVLLRRQSSPIQGQRCSPQSEEGERKGSPNIARSPITLLACRCQMSIHHCGRNNKNTTKLHLAAWNVRTLLDSSDRHERRSAIIGRELARYNIDIAALSETRISGQSEFVEVGAGYTFFCIGQPEGQPRQAGVGFAVKTSMLPYIEQPPTGISPRLMTLRLRLRPDLCAVLISAYAPTLMAADADKEAFYENLNSAIGSVPYKHRLFVLGDFNARIGRDFTTWPKVLGRHSVGNENANGTMLLQTCSQHELAITNTYFQLANKYKTTWQHPRSKHWHMLDYIITRQRDINEVHVTRAMRGTCCWSDHRLLRSVVALNRRRPRRHKAVRRKKLDVIKLTLDEYKEKLQDTLNSQLGQVEAQPSTDSNDSCTINEEWTRIKDITYKAATDTLGFITQRHEDWFDDNDSVASSLLQTMHTTHLAYINDKENQAKKSAYHRAKQQTQAKLREMKNNWWRGKAELLQMAADRHDMRAFYADLKAVYGPRTAGSTSVKSTDGTLLTDRSKILERWADHFQSVLNQDSSFDTQVLSEIPQWPSADNLDDPPSAAEIQRALKQTSSGKSPGIDGIPPEVLKHGGPCLIDHLHKLFTSIWEQEIIPQDFKDALVVHIYKRKGDRAVCDNHRGVSLLSIAGKVLARILMNRLNDHVHSNNIIPESQCGFRSGRGTADMIFTARQIQEKCREQHQDLFMVFIDLTKAFDTVSRPGLWMILAKIGCPQKFINIIRSFHDGMMGQVIDGGEASEAFAITNGTKQGCVLAALLFSIFFAMMLLVAFKDCESGIPVRFRMDGNVFNLRRLQARTKTFVAMFRDLLYADDCALLAHSEAEAQSLFTRFCTAATRFGLTVSLKKTEIMLQPCNKFSYTSPTITAGGSELAVTDKFCYLGSILSSDALVDEDISARLAKASQAFGRLSKRLWDDHGIRLDTKISVYVAAILPILLYGCESWTLYRRNIRKLDQFHMRCLRRIAHVRWQDKIPNTEVLQICGVTGIEAFIMSAHFRWVGHVTRMDDTRLPKIAFYCELEHGTRSLGGQRKRFKDMLKTNMKACDMQPKELESLTADRSSWRSLFKKQVSVFEDNRVHSLQDKRVLRKTGHQPPPDHGFTCDICSRVCTSRIGLFSHRRTHTTTS